MAARRNQVGLRLGDVLPGSTDNGEPGVPVVGKPEEPMISMPGPELSEFKRYRRKQIAELRSYVSGESLDRVSVTAADREAGSPKAGDMIARNLKNHADQWLVAAQYFADNFEPLD